MTFGEKLKQARTDAGLKQSELAKMIGTTNTTISNWEKGVSKPDLDMLAYICGALHVKASYFLQPIQPDDEINVNELNMVKKYRTLDTYGKETVQMIIDREYLRCHDYMIEIDDNNRLLIETKSFNSSESKIASANRIDSILNAAHGRTDIKSTDEMHKHDDDIMDDENF